ncbi:MAG: MoaD/ThiS family protein [Halanaerobiales bacterium]|nr:MoaD/ThiS family protein [Halanaerobiales bacterium]
MVVKVKFHSLFKLNLKSAGINYYIDQPISIEELIKKLDNDFEGYFSEKLLDTGQIKPGSIILINGKNVLHIDKLDTLIEDGDNVTLFPPSAGG